MKQFIIFCGLIGAAALAQTLVDDAQLRTRIGAPNQTVTLVTPTTVNAYPIPASATTGVCIVSNNIPMAPGIDYNITVAGGQRNVVFLIPPIQGDVVLLNCW